MKIVGIDLAGKIENPTGVCLFKNNEIQFKTVYSDEQILDVVSEFKPDIIAIDAPIIRNGIPHVRKADEMLKKYKTLPPNLPGMKTLTVRGSKIAAELKTKYKVIEVFPTATAKILGIYNRDYRETVKKLKINVTNKHELDAYLCCITAKMHLEKKTVTIGDKDGKIVIPAEGAI
ncbi:MAG: DUF429 domain-containing protein [Thermoplasmata archaeon]|nr:MAG: DUF429 domain-containing protein [Thermoplasmata archaeon]